MWIKLKKLQKESVSKKHPRRFSKDKNHLAFSKVGRPRQSGDLYHMPKLRISKMHLYFEFLKKSDLRALKGIHHLLHWFSAIFPLHAPILSPPRHIPNCFQVKLIKPKSNRKLNGSKTSIRVLFTWVRFRYIDTQFQVGQNWKHCQKKKKKSLQLLMAYLWSLQTSVS